MEVFFLEKKRDNELKHQDQQANGYEIQNNPHTSHFAHLDIATCEDDGVGWCGHWQHKSTTTRHCNRYQKV